MARLRAADLERLAPLLDQLRALPELRERAPGTFTHRGGPFLHFHGFATGLVADVKTTDGWLRYDIERAGDRRTVVCHVRRLLRGDPSGLRGLPT